MKTYNQLTHEERYQIEDLLTSGCSQKDIAALLDRDKSSISREIRRNSIDGRYRAGRADLQAQRRRQGKSRSRIGPEVRSFVDTLIEADWSPEQVSGWLALDMDVLVSHEWIYLYVYRDKVAGGSLHTHLRTARARRRRRGGNGMRGRILGAVSIRQRPAIVESRGRIGDYEADTMQGSKGSGGLATLVERSSGGLLAAKLPDGSADEMSYACIALLSEAPHKVHTITSDNGSEFHGHAGIARALGAEFYFADPHSPWQRGCNENANGLLRQYFPKGIDFRRVSQTEVDEAVEKINNRPRKRLGWKSPNQVLYGINPRVALGT